MPSCRAMHFPSMASSKHFPIVILIALFVAAHLAHARESQFFSKATKETTNQQVPDKEKQQQETFNYSDQHESQTKVDEPNYIPDTTQNGGYGLYGHEASQLPPSAVTTSSSTVPEESFYGSFEPNNNVNYYEQLYKNTEGNGYYNKKDSYANEDDNKAGSFSNRYTSIAALNQQDSYYGGSAGNSYGNVKQEGMSDTRYMENGKYFYDVNNEEKYYPSYRYGYSRTPASRRSSTYNPNMMNNYRNPSYQYSGNSMEGYGQNQEYQNVEDEFEP
ncbi:hypothetical protein SAY86_010834 [Trapa natans]|uniref:Protein E6 n=1 Tax=Trapa natans TaxID=22666 RepID=A0AAN7LJ14_TRANT|nr:hypothetical protein SAY86_010834 [Trapa natans]